MISVCTPTLGEEELKNVVEAVKTNWISSKGKFVKEFEERFAEYVGAKYAVTTTSGTTALHLALASLDVKKGDEIIIPSFTMIATALPIIYQGAKPVLVDAEEKTWNMDTDKIEEKITDKTKAIMPVHIYGHPCDMDKINEIAGDYNLYVIEDAAEAHGAEYKGKKAGSLSDIGCFSFYANKIITTGEGGMIVTNDEEIYERAKLLKDLAFTKERRFLHYFIGFNYRMTNLQAAIGIAQLNKITELVEARRKNAYIYNKYLQDIEGITLPPEEPWAKNAYWMYSILIDKEKFGMSRDELIEKLKEKGIETRPFFVPMHQQPVFKEMGLFRGERYPLSEKLGESGLNLPSSSSLSEDEINFISRAIKDIKDGIT
jgi:perosamine synthetase